MHGGQPVRSTSRRSPRWRRPPPSPRRCGSGAECSASTTTFPRCSRRRRQRSICCPTGDSSSASAQGGASPSTTAMGLTFAAGAERVAKLKEVVALFKAHCTGDVLESTRELRHRSGYTGLPLPGATAPPTDHDRWQPQGGAVVRGAGGRHREPEQRRLRPRNDDGLTPQEEAHAASTTCAPRRRTLRLARHRDVALLHRDHGRRRSGHRGGRDSSGQRRRGSTTIPTC